MDFVFLGLFAGFAALSFGLIYLCDRLGGAS